MKSNTLLNGSSTKVAGDCLPGCSAECQTRSLQPEDRPAPKPVTTTPRADCITCAPGSCSSCNPERAPKPIKGPKAMCFRDCSNDPSPKGLLGFSLRFRRLFGKEAVSPPISLEAVMAYEFDHVIYRMMDKYQWTEVEAREEFTKLKQFLYTAATTNEKIAPGKKLDELWHNFILFTQDYMEFCNQYLGRYIHHRPNRRGEVHGKKDCQSMTGCDNGCETARKVGVEAKASCSCSNYCQCS